MDKNKSNFKIKYFDIWGLREEKNEWLEKNDVESTKWQALNPSDPYYFFVPKKEKWFKRYQKFPAVIDIFPINSVGIVTGRDDFVIDSDKRSLEARIRIFRDEQNDDNFIKNSYKELKDKPSSRWFLKDAREKIQKDEEWDECFKKILYRPFDERWVYYHPALIERHRDNVMQHILEPNLAMIISRSSRPDPWRDIQLTNIIVEFGIMATRPGNSANVFPLYFYNDKNGNGKHNGARNGVKNGTIFKEKKRKPNIEPKIINKLSRVYKKEISAEEIFYYIYATLYSNIYREKYQEFLKVDFPRVPFTMDYKLFISLGKLGEKLAELHLLKSPELNKLITGLCGTGNDMVENVEYTDKSVHINNQQYFAPIKFEVWNYYIGGYQVLYKWLKDRKGRSLSSQDIKHYCRIATVIAKTINLQKKIDNVYIEIEKHLLSI